MGQVELVKIPAGLKYALKGVYYDLYKVHICGKLGFMKKEMPHHLI